MTTVYTDTSPGSTPFPPTIHHWAAGVFVTSNVGTWSTNTTSDATPLGQVYSNSSNAQNDSVTWDFLSPIPAGTYTLTQGIKKASSNGIATFQYSNNFRIEICASQHRQCCVKIQNLYDVFWRGRNIRRRVRTLTSMADNCSNCRTALNFCDLVYQEFHE